MRYSTDLNAHHIQGYLPDGREIYIPLISHIEGNLWTGGCVQGVKLPDDFGFVLSLYPWEQYELGPDTDRLEVRLYDSEAVPDTIQLHELADLVHAWTKTTKTLVHCQAGLNRSNLVATMALMREGRTAAEAINVIREKRDMLALCNKTFEGYLLTLDEVGGEVA